MTKILFFFIIILIKIPNKTLKRDRTGLKIQNLFIKRTYQLQYEIISILVTLVIVNNVTYVKGAIE